jgi:large subunit ribosomal protein L10
MSKRVKSLMEKELGAKFSGLDGVAVISPRGINGVKNNQLRRKLTEKGMKMTVVKNTLARRAAEKTRLKGFDRLLDGPSALIYGRSSLPAIARLLVDAKKDNEKLELLGVFFDGEIYPGENGVRQVSQLPTREEAVANIVGLILGPGRKLAGAVKGPGGRLGGILKAIEDKAKEKEVKEAAPAPEAPAAAPV